MQVKKKEEKKKDIKTDLCIKIKIVYGVKLSKSDIDKKIFV